MRPYEESHYGAQDARTQQTYYRVAELCTFFSVRPPLCFSVLTLRSDMLLGRLDSAAKVLARIKQPAAALADRVRFLRQVVSSLRTAHAVSAAPHAGSD